MRESPLDIPSVVFLEAAEFDFVPPLLPSRFFTLSAEPSPEVSTVGEHVAWLERRLAQDGVVRAVLVAGPSGEGVALRYALAHPQRVMGLVLTSAWGLADELLEPHVHRIAAPTLLLCGDSGRPEPPAVIRARAARLTSARVLFLAGCGTASARENPSLFAFHLRAFLNDVFPPEIDLPREEAA